MAWIADLHIHSHFSMATSKECDPFNLYRWAALKGISVVGTGDFTHPGWRRELREHLIPAEPGFYRLKNQPPPEVPDPPEVRFVVSGELSTIYKKNDRTRKVHHLLILPSLEDADRVSDALESMGMNIRSDGRPILGMDSYHLLKIGLDLCPELIFIPAHIWTPHFSVFGSNSGFDRISECYEDLTETIWALETGLSSDPAMNWRWSALDRFTLISNSDAHNPQNLAREANLVEAEFSYQGLRHALRNEGGNRILATLEFFPEEGKYHYDGHRHCQVALEPEETLKLGGVCPVCGKKVTVGVLNRVMTLADRHDDFRPATGNSFHYLIPLRQVIGDAYRVGPASRKVEQIYFNLLRQFGPELSVLRTIDLEAITCFTGPLLGSAIERLRKGEVDLTPGYDGEYGKISIIKDFERKAMEGQSALFQIDAERREISKKTRRQTGATLESELPRPVSGKGLPSGKGNIVPSDEQRQIIETTARVIRVVAGPGTGKTRTLVEKMVHLLKECQVEPERITAVTFTNKAAAEIRERLTSHPGLDARGVSRLNLGTFHSIAWKILQQAPEQASYALLDANQSKALLKEILRKTGSAMESRGVLLAISRIKNECYDNEDVGLAQPIAAIYHEYQASLQAYRRWDFDDLILQVFRLWRDNPAWLEPFKRAFDYMLVDEFQDVNHLQYQLVKLWAGSGRQLMVIGDPNQSIYGFRGSQNIYFDQLTQDYPEDIVSLKLSRNYRSPAVVISAANQLISEQYQQLVSGGTITPADHLYWLESASEKMEARLITQEIMRLLGGSTMLSAHGQGGTIRPGTVESGDLSFSFGDFAILYRTGRQAAAFEAALTSEGLPYRVVGQTETLEQPAIDHFLAFFRYLLQPKDLFLLRAALSQSHWELHPGQLEDALKILLHREFSEETDPLTYLLQTVGDSGLHDRLALFAEAVDEHRNFLTQPSPEIVAAWMRRLDLTEHLELEHLARISENYPSLEEMLRFLPLATEADLNRFGMKTGSLETITLSTIHAAKGLEYPVVFLAGAEEGLLPFGNAPDEETIAEERRLFYVGITRTQNRLYLTNSKFRVRNGTLTGMEVSRFLQQLPQELLTKTEWKKTPVAAKQLELF